MQFPSTTLGTGHETKMKGGKLIDGPFTHQCKLRYCALLFALDMIAVSILHYLHEIYIIVRQCLGRIYGV